ncbi:hypothetical protein SPSYN_00379 [Sporotomaculum syntrophicum]|uniref:Uncharacterized protein n=1 Tax=Sporotomaculum syntrophicum TaxID=182264 RepID=A0A9D2WT61_9FIRM|nr:hypothetical protein SPSYN_00379 [Sporotomaculum syntrophicum]
MLEDKLKDVFGERVACQFIDINSSAMKSYPQVEKTIHQVLLPMTVINGIPRSHGFLDLNLIIDTVKQELDKYRS